MVCGLMGALSVMAANEPRVVSIVGPEFIRHCEGVLTNGVAMERSGFFTIEKGGSVTVEVEPSEGYYLRTWSAVGIAKMSNDVASVTAENPVTIRYEDVTGVHGQLIPIMDEIHYHQVYDRGDAAAVGAQVMTNVLYTKRVKLPECMYTLAHYKFKNWLLGEKKYNAGDFVQGLSEEVDSYVVFTAVWERVEFCVEFDKNLDAAEIEWAECWEKKGETWELPEVSAADYVFDGWYTMKDGGALVTEDYIFDEKVTRLYAHWRYEKYWVGFDWNDGLSRAMDVKGYKTYEEEWEMPEGVRVGYTLKGWATTNNWEFVPKEGIARRNVEEVAVPGTTNVLKAIWEPYTYKIVFHANADYYVGETKEQELKYGSIVLMPACGTTNFTGEFLGWAWSPKSEEADWEAGARVKSLTSKADDVIHLYAVWKDLRTDYSRAVGCEQVVIDSEGEGAWEVGTNGVKSAAAKGDEGSRMEARIGEAGLLTFEWKVGDAADVGVCGFWKGEEKVSDVPGVDWRGVQVGFTSEETPTNVSWVSYAEEAGALEVRNVKWYPVDAGDYSVVTYYENEDGLGGGQMKEQKVYAVAGSTIAANSFVRKGWKFAGWNTATNGTGKAYEVGAAVSSEAAGLKLYAIWKAQIQFEANGGEGVMEALEVEMGATVELPKSTFVREGFVFAGWATSEGATTAKYMDGVTISGVARPLTLYAVWNEYATITYCENTDGHGAGKSMKQQVYVDGKSNVAMSNTWARSGWKFVKWNVNANGSGVAYDVGDKFVSSVAGLTLYAQWVPEVRFNANGGTGEKMDTLYARATTTGYDVDLPKCTFTREGYVFAGWATSEGAREVKYADCSSVGIGEPLTLYAVWKRQIIYVSNYGDDDEIWKKEFVQDVYGSSAKASTNVFERMDWVLREWTMDEKGTGTVYRVGEDLPDALTTGQKLYAQWNVKIRFETNGGVGTMGVQEVTKDKATMLAKCMFTREGYKFVGWAKSASAANAEYGDEGAITIAKPTTLYAVWMSKDGSEFNKALGCDEAITFMTGTNASWTVCSDLKGVQSGYDRINGSELKAVLPSAGTLTFKWKVINAGTNDAYEFRVEGTKQVDYRPSASESTCTYECKGATTVSWYARRILSGAQLYLLSVTWTPAE